MESDKGLTMNQFVKYLWALAFFSVALGICYLGFVGISIPERMVHKQLADDKFPR
jgi:hypothetical protein